MMKDNRDIKKKKHIYLNKWLLSCAVILIMLIFVFPFVIVNNNGLSAIEQEVEQTISTRYDIPGIYYATSVNNVDVINIFDRNKGGLLYIGNNSSHTMNGGRLSGNKANYGGAVYIASGGTFTMNGGEIINNKAAYGGAIYVANGGSCYINGGRIANNAAIDAAAIYVEDGGTLVITDCLIEDNIGLEMPTINYYVDGIIVKQEICMNSNSFEFSLSEAPITSYEQCPGYFMDPEMTHGIEDGDTLYITNGVCNVYTRTATLDKINVSTTLIMGMLRAPQPTALMVEKKGNPVGDIVIPRQYDNEDIKIISDFSDCTEITAVYMSNRMTRIDVGAFSGCSSLENISISESMIYIGDEAFSECSSLTEITIPASVENIGEWAFDVCTSLTSINVDSNNMTFSSQDGILYDKEKTTLIQTPCGKTGEVIIPESVTEIGDGAFSECDGITSITFPSGLQTIGSDVFYYCTGLTSIDIPDGVTSIGSCAFVGCSNIAGDIVIPDGVQDIGKETFAGCSSLTSVTIGSGVENIGFEAFYGCSGLTEIILPGTTVPTLGNNVFDDTNDCPIYVPDTKVDEYKAEDGWTTYSSRIHSINHSGREE